MAHYQEVDYCSEEVRSVGRPAGVQQHIVKEKFEEVDTVARTGGHRHGHQAHRHGHNHGHHHGHNHGHNHGHQGHSFVVRETRVEEDFNTCTGEVLERKESFVYRSD